MTTAEVSVEVEAPPETTWEVAADPRNLPHWDRHIVAVSAGSSFGLFPIHSNQTERARDLGYGVGVYQDLAISIDRAGAAATRR